MLRLPRRKNVETYRGAASRGCNHSFSPPRNKFLCVWSKIALAGAELPVPRLPIE